MTHTVRPGPEEVREIHNIIDGVIKTCEAVLPKDSGLEIGLGWTASDFIKEEMDGTSGKTISFKYMEIVVNTTVDGWRDSLKATTAHEYAHTYFYESLGEKSFEDISFMWQQVLLDAQAQIFATRLGFEEPMIEAVDKEYLRQNWQRIKQTLEQEIDWYSELFYGGDNFETWTGYTLAYHVGQKLLELHDLEEFHTLKKSDVIEVGDEIFG